MVENQAGVYRLPRIFETPKSGVSVNVSDTRTWTEYRSQDSSGRTISLDIRELEKKFACWALWCSLGCVMMGSVLVEHDQDAVQDLTFIDQGSTSVSLVQ